MAKRRRVTKYSLRDIDDDLWRAFKARAAKEGRTIRFVVLALLRIYARHGWRVVETFDPERQE